MCREGGGSVVTPPGCHLADVPRAVQCILAVLSRYTLYLWGFHLGGVQRTALCQGGVAEYF
jgi:hypothetical protein